MEHQAMQTPPLCEPPSSPLPLDEIGTRLYNRLLKLTDAPSRESIQTLARWIMFYRQRPRYVTCIAHAFYNCIIVDGDVRRRGGSVALVDQSSPQPPSPKRKYLYLSVIHELLTGDAPSPTSPTSSTTMTSSNLTKQSRYKECIPLRQCIGQLVVVEAAKSLLLDYQHGQNTAVKTTTAISKQGKEEEENGEKSLHQQDDAKDGVAVEEAALIIAKYQKMLQMWLNQLVFDDDVNTTRTTTTTTSANVADVVVDTGKTLKGDKEKNLTLCIINNAIQILETTDTSNDTVTTAAMIPLRNNDHSMLVDESENGNGNAFEKENDEDEEEKQVMYDVNDSSNLETTMDCNVKMENVTVENDKDNDDHNNDVVDDKSSNIATALVTADAVTSNNYSDNNNAASLKQSINAVDEHEGGKGHENDKNKEGDISKTKDVDEPASMDIGLDENGNDEDPERGGSGHEKADHDPSQNKGQQHTIIKTEKTSSNDTTESADLPVTEVDEAEKRREMEEKEIVNKSGVMIKTEDGALGTHPNQDVKVHDAGVRVNDVKHNAKDEDTKKVKSEVAGGEEDATVDLDKQGIEAGIVQIDELLHSCRSIAKSQITREIRNDAVERLSALVQSIPPEVELFSQRLALEGIVDAKDVSVDDLPSLSDEVLNLNLHEALNVVEQLKSAIENQRAGRMECINLLIMSRCKFGSLEAAEAFYGVDEKLKQIHETKLKLSDAMELEGIDVEDSDRNDERDNIDNIVALAPLEWYTNNENEDSGMTKRARIS